jgi:hypothetical protein
MEIDAKLPNFFPAGIMSGMDKPKKPFGFDCAAIARW